jgi:hypothetical protein
MFETYVDHDLDADPVLFLPCGHFFSMTTLDGLIGIDRVYYRKEFGSDGNFLSPCPLIGTDVSEKAVQCPDCRSAIHSVRRYARITKFANLRTLERKHLMGVDEALDGFATKSPAKRNVKALLQLRKTIFASPMRQVSDACGKQHVEVPSPPVRPLIRNAQLLGEAFATKSKELNDESYKLTIVCFEDAVQLATESKSIRSEASMRIALVQFLIKWLDKDPNLKSRCEELLHPVLQLQDGFADDLVNQAKQLKQGLSGENDMKMIIRAMNQIEGYDYGGGASSHWYQCPNGHPYYIGECGGAMQTSRCLECGEVVGGANHQLQSNNRQWTGLSRLTNATT